MSPCARLCLESRTTRVPSAFVVEASVPRRRRAARAGFGDDARLHARGHAAWRCPQPRERGADARRGRTGATERETARTPLGTGTPSAAPPPLTARTRDHGAASPPERAYGASIKASSSVSEEARRARGRTRARADATERMSGRTRRARGDAGDADDGPHGGATSRRGGRLTGRDDPHRPRVPRVPRAPRENEGRSQAGTRRAVPGRRRVLGPGDGRRRRRLAFPEPLRPRRTRLSRRCGHGPAQAAKDASRGDAQSARDSREARRRRRVAATPAARDSRTHRSSARARRPRNGPDAATRAGAGHRATARRGGKAPPFCRRRPRRSAERAPRRRRRRRRRLAYSAPPRVALRRSRFVPAASRRTRSSSRSGRDRIAARPSPATTVPTGSSSRRDGRGGRRGRLGRLRGAATSSAAAEAALPRLWVAPMPKLGCRNAAARRV